jgi:hypothetical protein
MKEMLELHGIDLENCGNGNEALICFAAINCLSCQKFNNCDFAPKSSCPNMILTQNLLDNHTH